jgi:hypothetical protein
MIYALIDKETKQIRNLSASHFSYNFAVFTGWEEKELDYESIAAFCAACPCPTCQPIDATTRKWYNCSDEKWYQLKTLPDNYLKYKNTTEVDCAILDYANNTETEVAS